MSNFLAIATVTAALQTSLQEVVQVDVNGAQVTTVCPDAQGQVPNLGVNIFLYQVGTNAALQNADLPTRTSSGHLVCRPQKALNLDYLLSFYGAEGALEPQRLLGSTVRCMHARPLLTEAMINTAVNDPNFTFLAPSNLADQIERVRFSPLPLSLEELSKLWSVFFQTSYALSVAYRASVVLIEPDALPQPSLPVRDFNIYALPMLQPRVEEVTSEFGSNQPILSNSTLIITGHNLAGEITLVRISGYEVILDSENVSKKEIRLSLSSFPAGIFQPGVQSLQVLHQIPMGTPPTPHSGVESNVFAFVLQPNITLPNVAGGTITLNVDPLVGRSQQVVLLLNEYNPPPNRSARAYALNALPHDGTESEPMVFDQHDADTVITELGLDAPAQVWGVMTSDLSSFSGVTNDPARIQMTISGEGLHEIVISGAPADIDSAGAALQAGIRNAHPSAPFTDADVIRVGEQLLILPGSGDAAIALAPFGDDPAFAELGLDRTVPVSGRLSDDLSAFSGISGDPARFELGIGDLGPQPVTITGSPGTLEATRTALQNGIRAAHENRLYEEALVIRVGDRLLILHGIKRMQFSLNGVASGEYLVRMQVDGAQSWLTTDEATGQYAHPRLTVP